jgi:signal transduction histidine kinase
MLAACYNFRKSIPVLTEFFRKWLRVSMLVALALLFAQSATGADQPTTFIKLQSASFQLSDAVQPPTSDSWQNVALPDIWPSARYTVGDNGWYRFDIELSSKPKENWGIYIPRLNMNAAVYVNDYYLGDGGQFKEPLARNWNRPLFFIVSPGHWKSSGNVIYIRLKSYPGYGRLDPITIGPEFSVRPQYEIQVLVQNDINRALVLSTLFASIFIFGIWLRRRADSMYLWYALMALIWTLYTTNNVIRDIPVSAKMWDWITYSSTAWWTVTLAIFSHRVAGIIRPRLEHGFLIWAMLSTLAYALTDIRFISQTTVIWQVGSLVIGFIVVWELLAEARRERHILWLGISIAVVLMTGIHDWLLQSNFIPRWSHLINHILPYSAPLLILYIGWYLTGRFIEALRESEQLNITLEQRVNAAQKALAASFEELRVLEISRAAAGERERIYRDLHDDVGAKLLGLAISAQRANNVQEADLARSALQDLRDVVSRSAQNETLLSDLIADLRVETGQRVNAAGLILAWSFPSMKTDFTISAETALNLSRILRESVTNVLRHAEAKRVSIVTQIEQDQFVIEVVDDGKGCPVENLKQHRGMTGMRTRAATLNGTLEWTNIEPHGCKVRLSVPLQCLPPETRG